MHFKDYFCSNLTSPSVYTVSRSSIMFRKWQKIVKMSLYKPKNILIIDVYKKKIAFANLLISSVVNHFTISSHVM